MVSAHVPSGSARALTQDVAYLHGRIDSDVTNALILAGTMWKCSGMAVQISVTAVIRVASTNYMHYLLIDPLTC